MIIEKNKVVCMHYTLKNDNGEVLDSSEGRDPLPFIHGLGNIIPGLEKELEGKECGDKIHAVIAPEEGYGAVHENLVQSIPIDKFPSKDDVKVGATFHLQTPEGPMSASVKAIDGENVSLDFNHPLAGVTLHFDVEVTDVRDATETELSHGHVHNPSCGGHCH